MIEKHPYKPFVDSSTRKLIIGTAPPMRFSQKLQLYPDDVDFYYGSKSNYFWKLLGDVFGVDFLRKNSEEAVSQRKEFLTKNNIGLADIVFEFSRKNNDASDNNLHVIKFQDIYRILKDNHQIQTIYFTGYSGPNSAENLTYRHLKEHNVHSNTISKSAPRHKTFKIEGRTINSYSLYSPSPRVAKSYKEILSVYQILKNDR